MAMSLLFWALVLVSSCSVIPVIGGITDPTEVDALKAVKRKLKHPDMLSDWEGDPCTAKWTGVHCFNANNADGYLHVKEIRLMTSNLSGTLAPQLGRLRHLKVLDFMWNNLTGPIPMNIGKLSSLFLLLLNGNKLSGHLPSELGSLSNLDRFQIDENKISGPIPKSFGNMTKLKHIHFNNNSLSGQIPAELSKLSELIHLLLDNNNLSGNVPSEISDMPNLRILQLDNNNFRGSEIPTSYGNFSLLVKLSIRNCGLGGTLPDFSGITNLRYLDLSRNNISGELPSKLPEAVTTIELSNNNLNRSIPESYAQLGQLQKLSLENNNLSGTLPNLWVKRYDDKNTKLEMDNSLSDIGEDFLPPPVNVSLMLDGNPLCKKANAKHVSQFCGSDTESVTPTDTESNSTDCNKCEKDPWVEHVQGSPVECFCAAPILIGYRLKSPSFIYFRPFISRFKAYVTYELSMEPYQLLIDSYEWVEGPRLAMYLKLFPMANKERSGTFNFSEISRLRDRFSSWKFNGNHFFGPYELLNFTLEGPYRKDQGIQGGNERGGLKDIVFAAIIVGIIALTFSSTYIVALVIKKCYAKHRGRRSSKRPYKRLSLKVDGVKNFTLEELERATHNFSSTNQVGRGGYGKVYRGILSDSTIVAIKRAEEASIQGEKEFLNEILLLSRLHHRNLVSLIGYCDEDEEQMLVYEFMPNGTLHDWLSGKVKETLDFRLRLGIGLDSAKGILYLHTEANPPVIHRDIKASNILLDSKLNAKVADFGLSRLLPVFKGEGITPKCITTAVKGTPGYLDPEYFFTHKLTEKSDVYSLGVVFLELLTGMTPISQGKNIVREVTAAYQSGMIYSVIDSRMGLSSFECVEKFTALALCCSHEKPEMRPTMAVVVKELQSMLETLPETETSRTSESSRPLLDRPSSSSSPYNMIIDQRKMLDVSGSNLHSDFIPTINPR